MKRFLTILLAGLTMGGFAAQAQDLALSDMRVKITSQDHAATFQLYDTAAARQLYHQLPLTLDLSNFRDAQWMFYPPKKLTVTAKEAYHDGKKGELSYYAPWGDAFMLYKDFYAGDQMHRLGINLTGIEEIEKMSGRAFIERIESRAAAAAAPRAGMAVTVISNGNTTVFQLNDSTAAKQLYDQLPLRIKVEDHSSNEKIFYPPKELDTKGTPGADARTGTLAYYAPWGDVVMFYGPFGSHAGLYELGQAVSGENHIKGLSGTIEVRRKNTP